MDLTIIIVSWNVVALLETCLQSIEAAPLKLLAKDGRTYGEGRVLTQVIVVDSDSHDNSAAMVAEKFPWVHLFALKKNIGFVRGNNYALPHAKGRHIMLLNPDTLVTPEALPRLVAVLDNDETIGVVGPQVLNPDGSHQSTRRRFPTLMTGIFESTWLESFAPRVIRRFRVEDMPNDGVYEVDWVQGCALMGRASLWRSVGELDERYIMFSEELDWCKRVKDAGWKVLYVGDAHITHYGGQSTTQVKGRSHVHFQHSKIRYFHKFHGAGAATIIRLVLILNYAWQMGLESGKWLVGHKREMRAERLSSYWLVLRSLFGGERVAMKKA